MPEQNLQGKKVLIVGAGPAGLRAAEAVARQGGTPVLVGDRNAPPVQQAVSNGLNVIVLDPFQQEITSFKRDEDVFIMKVKNKVARIDDVRCDGCGECERVCPVHPVRYSSNTENHPYLRTAISRSNRKNNYTILKEDPPCQQACPVKLDIRGYVGLIAEGKYDESLALIRQRLPFPAVCGRICPHFCERKCNRRDLDEAINIRGLKRFVADRQRKGSDGERRRIETIYQNKVAIIGGGPAGLTCAHDLRILGYPVTVFESLPVCGGMLAVGIPDFRLPKEILQAEIKYIEDLGVDLKTNVTFGIDVTSKQLFEQGFEAIFIATGAHDGVSLGIKGEMADGVIQGTKLLRDINLREEVVVAGKKAIVIGGGNVAIDAARSLKRLGANEVVMIYRRTCAEMPAYKEEVEAALKEGITIEYLTMPTEIISEGNRVKELRCVRATLAKKDKSGRRSPVPIEGSEFGVPCDLLVVAAGQKPELAKVEGTGMKATSSGTIFADRGTGATNIEGIFAGGDAVSGPATAIEAIAAGKTAALSIHQFLIHKKRAQ